MTAELRRNLYFFILTAIIITIATLTFDCTSSQITNVWRDPAFISQPMKNILIVAAKRNPVNRRIWEDEIVTSLSDQGVVSTPSYRLFPDSIPSPEQVGSTVRDNKFDGVLFIRRLPTRISTNYIPGDIKSVQVTQYDERTKTYSSYYKDVEQPGSTDTDRVVRHEISVFTTQPEGGHLIWAGTGELINPASRDEVRQEISGLISPELVRQKIIPGK